MIPETARLLTCDRVPVRIATVVVRTARVAFVEDDGELLALHGPGLESFPFSVVVSERDVNRLPSDGSLGLGDGVVVLADGRRLAARRPAAAVPGPPGVNAPAMLRALGGVPGLAARSAAAGPLDDPERLLGRGQGLTPSGDDVLIGFIAMCAHAHREWGLPDPAPLAAALAARAPGRTTAVSAALLAEAARGRFAPVVGAVCRASSAELPAALARLAAVGATSGLDTLVGVERACRSTSPPPGGGPASSG